MNTSVQGIGVGLRRPFAADLLATARRVDWLEVTPENWMFHGGRTRRLLDACIERWPVVPHSVSLDVGGGGPLSEPFLDRMEALCRRTRTPWWSDHVCWSSYRGRPLNDLLPLPFTEEAVDHVARRAAEVRRRVEAPLALENATFYSHMPGAEMDEAAFLCAVVERSGCGLLLDVNNVYVNSRNHGFDARAFIDRIPLDRVWQLHLAGHTLVGDTIIDTHIGPVIGEVWALYEYTVRRAARLIPTLIEWDQDIPPLDAVLDEVDRARAHAAAALSERAA
jgi:uncharacterized protein (UPF0276 family)